MKKTTKVLVSAVCAAAICGSVVALGGCSSPADGSRNTEIVVTGSSSVTPLMEKLAAVYEVLNEDVKITIQMSDSGTGIADAQQGKNDFGMASRNLKDNETGVVQKTICNDGVALVVNASCTLSNVTANDIYGLYANGTAIGQITNAISREDGSGTRDAFDGLIKNESGDALSKLTSFANCVDIQNTTGAVKSAIQSNGAGNTLGYISMGALDNTVKVLTYGGVAATAENVKNGTYKLSRPFNIVYKSESALSSAAKDFIEFIMGGAGQYIAEYEGYIAL